MAIKYFTKSASAKAVARKLMRAIPVLSGHMRTVNRCQDCRKLFGRSFIPYGLGRGIYVDARMCQLTAHRPFSRIAESRP